MEVIKREASLEFLLDEPFGAWDADGLDLFPDDGSSTAAWLDEASFGIDLDASRSGVDQKVQIKEEEKMQGSADSAAQFTSELSDDGTHMADFLNFATSPMCPFDDDSDPSKAPVDACDPFADFDLPASLTGDAKDPLRDTVSAARPPCPQSTATQIPTPCLHTCTSSSISDENVNAAELLLNAGSNTSSAKPAAAAKPAGKESSRPAPATVAAQSRQQRHAPNPANAHSQGFNDATAVSAAARGQQQFKAPSGTPMQYVRMMPVYITPTREFPNGQFVMMPIQIIPVQGVHGQMTQAFAAAPAPVANPSARKAASSPNNTSSSESPDSQETTHETTSTETAETKSTACVANKQATNQSRKRGRPATAAAEPARSVAPKRRATAASATSAKGLALQMTPLVAQAAAHPHMALYGKTAAEQVHLVPAGTSAGVMAAQPVRRASGGTLPPIASQAPPAGG